MGLLEQFHFIVFLEAVIISLLCVVNGLIEIIAPLVRKRCAPDVTGLWLLAIGLLLGGGLYGWARLLGR